jgi:hypothetical protein
MRRRRRALKGLDPGEPYRFGCAAATDIRWMTSAVMSNEESAHTRVP